MARKKASRAGRMCYYFGKTRTDGKGVAKDLLGGKGINLAEMTSIGNWIADVLDDLEGLGFNVVGYGCTTCIGNSGPLAEPIESAIRTARG